MTDRDDKQLPLPSPRSPRELDRKILAHARANAPARRAGPLPWVGGLATAAVLVLAVFLVDLTEQTSLQEEETAAAAAARAEPTKIRTAEKRAISAERPAPEARAPAEFAEAPAAKAQLAAQADSAVAGVAAPANPLPELVQIREQLQAGNREAAEKAYLQLRQECPGCELPETLEQAMRLLETTPPER